VVESEKHMSQNKITDYVRNLPTSAIADWASGKIDAVMADALHSAIGVEAGGENDANYLAVEAASTLAESAEWTCRGSVRGGCGHTHYTLDAAEQCCRHDATACRRSGGYSDRLPVIA